MNDFSTPGSYVTRGGWKADVIHATPDGKVVVRHYSPESGETLKIEALAIHGSDGAFSGNGVSFDRISDLVGEWSDREAGVDVLHVFRKPYLRPRMVLESAGRPAIPESLRFRLTWDCEEPAMLKVEALP